jgi:serine/threonine protein kinase
MNLLSSLNALHEGDVIKGRYRILSVTGSGSFSTVYSAMDLQAEGARWAIKELREADIPENEREIAVRLFGKEAALLKMLNHPGIPKIIDHFSCGTRHFMVLEYVEGETLQARLERQAVDARLLISTAIKICDILTYLHGLKPFPVIYRDLKPSNIMITSGGRIKLIDFGTARFYKIRRAKDTCLLGTPGFCPPEQYGTRQSSIHNDIYALGATLYYLLSGVNLEQLNYEIPRLSHFNRSVPSKLERIVERCMRIDPSRRYRSAEELRRDLERLLDRSPAPLPAPSPLPAAPRGPFPRKTRLIDDASQLTRLLDAPSRITRLLIDSSLLSGSGSSAKAAGRANGPILNFRASLATGAVLALCLIITLAAIVMPRYNARESQRAEKKRIAAIVNVLDAFPAYHAPPAHSPGAPSAAAPLPSKDVRPPVSLPPSRSFPAPGEPVETGDMTQAPQRAVTVPGGYEPLRPDASAGPSAMLPAASARPAASPPALTGSADIKSCNNIMIRTGDGSTSAYQVPEASSSIRNSQVARIHQIPVAFPPYRGAQAANPYQYQVLYDPASAKASPGPPKANCNSSGQGTSSMAAGSGRGDYGFVPASSPSEGINDSSFDSQKGDYGFVPASNP